jgi:hypothetical protein
MGRHEKSPAVPWGIAIFAERSPAVRCASTVHSGRLEYAGVLHDKTGLARSRQVDRIEKINGRAAVLSQAAYRCHAKHDIPVVPAPKIGIERGFERVSCQKPEAEIQHRFNRAERCRGAARDSGCRRSHSPPPGVYCDS